MKLDGIYAEMHRRPYALPADTASNDNQANWEDITSARELHSYSNSFAHLNVIHAAY